MKGYLNAEKWTEDLFMKILNSMIVFASSDYEVETSSTSEEDVPQKALTKRQQQRSQRESIQDYNQNV